MHQILRPSLVSQGLLDLSTLRTATSLEVSSSPPPQLFIYTTSARTRMLPRSGLAVVPPTVPLVDDVLPRALVLDLLLSLQSAVLSEL